MNDSPFRSKEDELRSLSAEIAEAKAVLRELASTLQRLERHISRAFKSYDSTKIATSRPDRRLSVESTLTPTSALQLFDDLVSKSRMSHDRAPVKSALEQLTTADLLTLGAELGVSAGPKPSRKRLLDAILGRVHESNMLGRNVNVTPADRDSRRGAT